MMSSRQPIVSPMVAVPLRMMSLACSASKDAPSEALDIVVSVIDLLMRLKTNKPNQNGEDQSAPKP
jgi:hypothetical protein